MDILYCFLKIIFSLFFGIMIFGVWLCFAGDTITSDRGGNIYFFLCLIMGIAHFIIALIITFQK